MNQGREGYLSSDALEKHPVISTTDGSMKSDPSKIVLHGLMEGHKGTPTIYDFNHCAKKSWTKWP